MLLDNQKRYGSKSLINLLGNISFANVNLTASRHLSVY